MTTHTTVDIELLREVSLRLTRMLRRHVQSEMTMSQLSAMSTLARHPVTRVGDLARREAVGKSTVTRLAARLRDLGYVNHVPDPEDGRSYLIVLTDRGRDILDTADRQANRFLIGRVERLSREDRAAIAAALPALRRLVGQHS